MWNDSGMRRFLLHILMKSEIVQGVHDGITMVGNGAAAGISTA